MTSPTMTNFERVTRLHGIQQDMLALLAEAKQLLRGTEAAARAESYWLAHIRIALDDEHGYLAGSMCTLQDTIDELAEGDES